MAAATPIDPRTLPVTSELATRLRDHVEFLASPALRGRQPGTPENRKAADYIAAHFRDAGLDSLPSLRGYAQALPRNLGDNLFGLRRAQSSRARSAAGASLDARWILIGAHFDHLGDNYLGADDNASAVAIVLELARRLPALPNHHVLFAAFNAEEPPYIRTPEMGSQYFVSGLPPEIGSPANFQAVIIMDLMGGAHWAPLREVLFAAGAEESPGLYRRLKEAAARETLDVKRETKAGELPAFRLTPHPGDPLIWGGQRVPLTVLPVGMHLVEEIPLIGRVSFSDYDAFRNAGVPFLFLSSGRTPRYHQPTDLPDTLHYERMAASVDWLAALVQRVDEDEEPYRVEAGRVEFADEVASLRPLVALAASRDTMIPGTSFLSLWKLKRDQDWLAALDPDRATPQDVRRLERLSIRLQCLLADFPGCFLF